MTKAYCACLPIQKGAVTNQISVPTSIKFLWLARSILPVNTIKAGTIVNSNPIKERSFKNIFMYNMGIQSETKHAILNGLLYLVFL